MKKFLAVLCSLATLACGVAAFSACGVKDPVPEGGGYALKIGYTQMEPMNYFDESGKLIGFETEFAEKVCGELGYTPEFIEIDWNTKETSLKAGEIDLVWNGMTITPELQAEFLITDSYMDNQQVVIVKTENADKFKTIADLANAASIAYESGSAAAKLIEGDENLSSVTKVSCPAKKDAFFEVYTGASEVGVVDVTMARAMTAEGKDYHGALSYTDVGYAAEQYGIAMRKIDTVLCTKLNELIAKYKTDGTFDALVEKYF